jgi:hypothetical protein
VRALIDVLVLLYQRRGALREVLFGRHGKMLFPAFPELLARPPKRTPKGEYAPAGPDFSRRRSDGMEAIIRVILVVASCCDWRSMEIVDPSGGYLSVRRIAELADLPWRPVWPREGEERRRRFRMDTVERVLRLLRTARIIAFTKQHRDQLEDGRYTTTAPALRKLSVGFFKKFGGALTKTFDWRRDKLKKKAAKAQTDAFLAGNGVDLRIREELRKHTTRSESSMPRLAPMPAEPSTPLAPWRYSEIPEALSDAIAAEHPEWLFGEVMAEARRRLPEWREPPTCSSGELPKAT